MDRDHRPQAANPLRLRVALSMLAAGLLALPCATQPSAKPAWDATGAYRFWISVPPRDLPGRDEDAAPAHLLVDFEALLGKAGIAGKAAPASIRILQYDPASGQSLPHPDYRADAPCDVPHRFDNARLRDYSYMYNLLSEVQQGDLVWVHRQRGHETSLYAVYFDLGAPGAPEAALPRPQIGDIDALYQREGGSLSSLTHARPAIGDWDNDGLPDLMVGDILGHILLHKNLGAPGRPVFGPGRLVHTDGDILDVGWYAAPKLVDWDGDGDLDLLCGADGGKVFWFENTGGLAGPALQARGPLTADGQPIVTPALPCPETPFMTKDYVPVPEAVDWDGDGDLDLLVGGYTTGQAFHYENVRNAPGVGELHARGTLEADGRTLDVLWQAAPCAADFDGDGDLDLLCGTLDQRVGQSQADPWPSFFYFENRGTRAEPKLAQRPFPLDENIGSLTDPCVLDWDADGDMDIVVGVGAQVRLLRNTGGSAAPAFRAEPPLTAPWTPRVTSGFAVAPVDWDADGDTDLIYSGERTATFVENVEPSNPPEFVVRDKATAGGEVIDHEFLLGDDHSFAEPFDWDNDGDLDYFLGNSAGHVWYYENIGTARQWSLAAGRRFALENGAPLLVGQPEDTPMTDFATHSGNRSDPAPGDFDGDGDHDLVVSDAYGKVTYFENRGSNAAPVFAAGRELLAGAGRCVLCAADWDADGLIDLIVSWAGEQVWFCRNVGTAAEPCFERTRAFALPWMPYPHPYALDWNRDGDVDLVFACSYAFLYFGDRSFLDAGYAEGVLGAIESRDAS